MESAAFVSKSVLAGSELTEVLGGFWHSFVVQLEDDTTSFFATDGDIKLDLYQTPREVGPRPFDKVSAHT